MITLRPVCPADDDFLRQVYASTREAELALVDWSAEEKAAFLQMQFDAQRQHYLVYYPAATYHIILRDGVAIGRIIVQRTEEEILLMDLALLPPFRNAGVGTHLLQALQTEATQRGNSVRLHVVTFDRARRLYERLGFRQTGASGYHLELEWRPVTAGDDATSSVPEKVNHS